MGESCHDHFKILPKSFLDWMHVCRPLGPADCEARERSNTRRYSINAKNRVGPRLLAQFLSNHLLWSLLHKWTFYYQTSLRVNWAYTLYCTVRRKIPEDSQSSSYSSPLKPEILSVISLVCIQTQCEFLVYLITLSVSRSGRRLMNNEWERTWNEAVMSYFLLSLHLPGGTKKYHGEPVSGPRFEPGRSRICSRSSNTRLQRKDNFLGTCFRFSGFDMCRSLF